MLVNATGDSCSQIGRQGRTGSVVWVLHDNELLMNNSPSFLRTSFLDWSCGCVTGVKLLRCGAVGPSHEDSQEAVKPLEIWSHTMVARLTVSMNVF